MTISSGLSGTSQTSEADLQEMLNQARTVLWDHFGVLFQCYSLDSHQPLAGLTADRPSWCPPECWTELLTTAAQRGEVFVRPISNLLQVLVIPFVGGPELGVAAVGLFATRPWPHSENELPAVELLAEGTSDQEIPFCHGELLRRSGEAAREAIAEKRRLSDRDQELQQLASALSNDYEAITLLYQLTREARVSRGPRELHELALTLLFEVLPAAQMVLINWEDDTVICRGAAELTPEQCRQLMDLLEARKAEGPLVENHIERKPWSDQIPGLRSLIAVPVSEAGKRLGTLLALNTVDGSELGSVEASLISAVASILATHDTNVKLFHDLDEIFMGIVRALSSAIDAKDPYTRGHSERVARIARRLGHQLGLPEDQSDLLYLAGLLHDVGKIGIRDSVLCNPGRLSDEEFQHIKQHTRIGYDILCGVRQLSPVLPGVRSHHEAIDGRGYPDGLKAQNIPLMARILAVADAYDAMSSDRVYRKGLYRERIKQIFREGAGKQWDRAVVDALLTAHGEIAQLAAADREPAEGNRPGQSPGHWQPSDLRRISQLLSVGRSGWVDLAQQSAP